VRVRVCVIHGCWQGDISQRTVDDGFKALLAVEAYLKAGGGPQLATLCSAFYT